MKTKKPVILLTIHRRYFELSRALNRIEEFRELFREEPDVVVVWAQPEVSRLWYFAELIEQGKVTQLLTRLKLPYEGEKGATTYPESHNLRLGLQYILENYDHETTYVIGMACDVLPSRTAVEDIDWHMQEDGQAFLYFWDGGVRSDAWHTNFFAVSLDERYWPPVASPDEQDTLEWMWGKKLRDKQLPGIRKSSNANGKLFKHEHLSESHPAWPHHPQADLAPVTFAITGYKSWWRRFCEWLNTPLW